MFHVIEIKFGKSLIKLYAECLWEIHWGIITRYHSEDNGKRDY